MPPQPPNTTVKEDKQSGYIIDTGSGIAPEHHRAVFEEFRQVGNDLARKAELLPTRQ